MTSVADKVRVGFGMAFCVFAPFLVYRDAVHIFSAAAFVIAIATSISLLIASRSSPLNWRRFSISFVWLSLFIPAVVFFALFRFREGL
jgi:hypothetical protein